jgi:hypothetical protein
MQEFNFPYVEEERALYGDFMSQTTQHLQGHERFGRREVLNEQSSNPRQHTHKQFQGETYPTAERKIQQRLIPPDARHDKPELSSLF